MVPIHVSSVINACRQLERLQIEHPDKRVAVVTFGSVVRVYGEGKSVCVEGDILYNYDTLLEKGRGLWTELDIQPLTTSYR